MTAQRATQAAGAATKRGVAPMATPAAVSGATSQRPAVRPTEEEQRSARRPVDAISLALAAAMNESTARRAVEAAEHPMDRS